MADFKIPLHELDSLGKDYSFTLSEPFLTRLLADCAVRPEPERPGTAQIHAQRNGREVLVQGSLEAELVAECVRCLGDAHFHVRSELATLLTPADEAGGVDLDDLEIDPSEPDREYYSGDAIELDGLIREYLALELPTDPLCAEACPGIEIPEHLRPPEDLGATENESRGIDPRLAPLKKLAQGEPDKE